MTSHFPLRLMVNGPKGPVTLTAHIESLPLPQGPDPVEPELTYGPYLAALSRFLSRDSCAPLLEALSMHLGKPVDLDSIREVEIISQKHGALYNVAQVKAEVCGETHSLALNVAMRPDQKAFLETEFNLLGELHRRFGLPYLPRPYVSGEVRWIEGRGTDDTCLVFLVEWFDGYHEFHLSMPPGESEPAIDIWTSTGGPDILESELTHALYSQASSILTSYFDENTYEQIYPWHHAAGDFVVRKNGNQVEVRLITARDYRCLVPLGPNPDERWIAVALFFLNMTLRMRLDRFDGTGSLAWAHHDCLRGAVEGFSDAWRRKAARNSSLPAHGKVLEVLRSFTPQEWLPLAELVLDAGRVESSEVEFLRSRLEDHVAALTVILQE